MSVHVECPRCDKRVPSWAAYCRRCGLPLEHVQLARIVSPPSTPPLTRLIGIIVAGACIISMAALSRQGSYAPPAPGGYGGGGGGGGVVNFPFNPFGSGPNVQTTPSWPPGYEPPQPGVPYTPRYNSGRSRYGAPYGSPYGGPYTNPNGGPYGNPYGSPRGGPYGGPSAPGPGGGGSRGPGR